MNGALPTISIVMKEWVRKATVARRGIPLLGLCGAQGIGKTTALNELHKATDLKVAVLSLDDFYLGISDRDQLARTVHPLCRTRGAPGTHDIGLLSETIQKLQSAGASDVTSWPKFDKVTDDRSAELCEFVGKPDAIMLEGWLVGALSDPSSTVSQPINALERIEDPDGVWRAWQERALADRYEPFWQLFDEFLYLCAPSFETVYAWRCEQEETTLGLAKGSLPEEKREWVARFIQHYERITRRILSGSRMFGTEVRVNEKRTVLGP